ncbi:MAG: hypothetical protein JNL74_09615 [Fibrobacteres bacterium]|nr:hypothetical protein [Fibrobacterota bacterium]
MIGLVQLGADIGGIYSITQDFRGITTSPLGSMIGIGVMILNRMVSLPANHLHNNFLDWKLSKHKIPKPNPLQKMHSFGLSGFVFMQGGQGVGLGLHYRGNKHYLRVSYSVYSDLADTIYYATFNSDAHVGTPMNNEAYYEYLGVLDKHSFTLSYDYPIIRLDRREILIGGTIRHCYREYLRVAERFSQNTIYTKETDYISSMQASAKIGFNWRFIDNLSFYFTINALFKEWDTYINVNSNNFSFYRDAFSYGGEYGLVFWY